MSARSSYWAARWSLEVLLGRRSSAPVDLLNPAPVPCQQCYLWTFTTPDVCDASTVLRRWRGVVKNWPGFKCFRVLEEHPGGHGWHVHFVTVERLDVREVRKRTLRHSFGRIHVKQIPASEAVYVVKYLVKALRRATGRRLWACVGYEGVRANDLEIRDTFWSEVYSAPSASGYSLGARRQLGLARLYQAAFQRGSDEPKRLLEAAQFGKVATELEKGSTVVAGEYRGTRIDELRLLNKRMPWQCESRVVLRHALECGDRRYFVIERLPDDVRPADVRVSLKKGALTMVVVRTLITERTLTEVTGQIVAL